MLNQGDDKNINSIIGIVLIFAILIGYSIYTQPTPEQKEAARMKRDSSEAAYNAQLSDAKFRSEENIQEEELLGNTKEYSSKIGLESDSATNFEALQRYGEFSNSSKGEEQLLTLENENIKINF